MHAPRITTVTKAPTTLAFTFPSSIVRRSPVCTTSTMLPLDTAHSLRRHGLTETPLSSATLARRIGGKPAGQTWEPEVIARNDSCPTILPSGLAPPHAAAPARHLREVWQMPRSPRGSERPGLHLAESHDAAAVLQREPALGELGILGAVDGLDAVEDHGEFPAFGGDVIGVPLVAGLGHRRHLGNIDDRAGAVTRVGARIEDVDLIGICRRDLLGIGGADEDAAVGGGVDPELGPELEVAVFLLRDQEAVAEVGLHDAALEEPPIGVADGLPIVQVGAVEQGGPTGLRGLPGGVVRVPKYGGAGENEPHGNSGSAVHLFSPPHLGGLFRCRGWGRPTAPRFVRPCLVAPRDLE